MISIVTYWNIEHRERHMKKYILIDKNTMSRDSFLSLIYSLEDDAVVLECKSLDEARNLDNTHTNTNFIVFHATYENVLDIDFFEQLQELAPKSKCLLVVEQNHLIQTETLPEHIYSVTTVDSPKSEIIAAIRSIRVGQKYIGQHVQKATDKSCAHNDRIKFPTLKHRFAGEIKNKLTPRQCEVLDYMIKGYANKLIAYELGVSEGTVKLHVSSILRALKVTNRTEAAMRAGHFLNSPAH